jgi:hypothetical protein
VIFSADPAHEHKTEKEIMRKSLLLLLLRIGERIPFGPAR